MEKLEQYRHFIEPEVKLAFLEGIKKAVKEVDTSKFGFIGIIGSAKENKSSNDIDVLISQASPQK